MLKVGFIGHSLGVHEKRFLRGFDSLGIPAIFYSFSELLESPNLLRHHYELGKFNILMGGPLTHYEQLTKALQDVPFIAISYAYDVLYTAKDNAEVQRGIRKLLKNADGVLVDCDAVKTAIKEMAGDQVKVHSMVWGLEKCSSNHKLRAELKSLLLQEKERGSKIVVCVRNFTAVHGCEVVLRAFHLALAKNPKMHLVLTGAGELSEQMYSLAEEFDIMHKVSFIGNIEEPLLVPLLECCDVYMSSSLVDGTSISLLQALEAGLPVILSAVGGNVEWVNRITGGYLFDCGDVNGAAEQLLLCSESNDCYRYDRRVVMSEYADWSENMRKFVQFCDDLKLSKKSFK
ncbi:glycosyltransferase family 4 protein [Persicirhabdus sediminis]|uniref:Glycosyltransferase family 4 protein n=1 Tax=Persicirhabdus sediminis TaxID=454144 RepID=A0A8J7MF17_9BACT|nr:glycosyltransferase family 4 protein [Persicirhabdus sediminis]MBK1792774.1 glycosyltransferase family 4 protein [Persicirhabdus sediminis]